MFDVRHWHENKNEKRARLRAEECASHQMSTSKWENEEKRKAVALNTIRNARSSAHMVALLKAMIDKSWLRGVDNLPGNIYRIWALGGTSCCSGNCGDILMRYCRLTAGIAIAVLQFLTPPVLCLGQFLGWGVEEDKVLHWGRWHPSLSDWHGPDGFVKFISICFFFLFLTNGLLVVVQEERSRSKLMKILGERRQSQIRVVCLMIDTFNNDWVVVWCCLACYPILGCARSAAEVVFDGLSLLFLYNIDDVGGGHLGLIDPGEWPGDRLGWVSERIEQEGSQRDGLHRSTWVHSEFHKLTYKITMAILTLMWLVLPTLFIITPFEELRGEGIQGTS